MEAIWTSVVAVAGTLLGVMITHHFQRRAAVRGEEFTRSEALRRERIDCYSAFAGAAEEYRRGQADRWYGKRRDPEGPEYTAARDRAHHLRTAARQALYRVKLLTTDAEVLLAADRAYVNTREISTAGEEDEHRRRDQEAREAIEAFVTRASPLVR
ncbi:hypothetical protein FNQ90_02405 [Streptomyces alkaliphilus]|uniref:Uncharacterized protein n=1 Tax=Streptomyces alkaliphilus TaxID=1472722 RepID=A0A7W3TA74_9ACTN|nr:hypothetical protein [Streptomyces alkaliphilus]MBB0242987.1 hypothetical protein [Streptomyces alkaliphilus]